jgi:phage tail-like protein
MPQGTPRTWYKKFSWVVEIDGVARAAFQKCSELAIEVADVAYKEGGDPVPFHSPGTVTVPEITLERGVTNDFDLYNWMKSTIDSATGLGENEPGLMRQFDIVQLDRNGDEIERYTVYEGYCRRYAAGDWDMDADENRIESVVIQPRYWERTPS